jgi:P27 family predicted phage terminase small subunit
MKPGPKPLPNNVHALTGNRSKKALSDFKDAIQPEVAIPGCPSHLLPEARKEWKRITPQLEKLRVITHLDRSALSVYCQAYGRWVQAEQKLKALGDDGLIDMTPSGYRQISVWLQISNRAAEQMHKFMTEFGLTPSSRSRVSQAAEAGQVDLFGGEQVDKSPARFFGG